MTAGGARRLAVIAALTLAVSGCGQQAEPKAPPVTAPSPKSARGDCGELRIAYDPRNGYEASAFIIGALARSELECDVRYVRTTSRKAWRVVARGEADVYLDAYGSPDLVETLTARDGPVTVLGPNGIQGGVDLLAPFFMEDDGIESARDLEDLPAGYFRNVTPVISTVPSLLPLAQSFIEFQRLDFVAKDYTLAHPDAGMGDLLQAPALNDRAGNAAFFLVEAPRTFLGDGAGRLSIEIPGSAAGPCVPTPAATLCSLGDFEYTKIVNSKFADSRNPAYNLVYNYRLPAAQAATILDLVRLSGMDVGEADVVSWINTHEDMWKRWLK